MNTVFPFSYIKVQTIVVSIALVVLIALSSLAGCDNTNNTNNNPRNEAPSISAEALTSTSTCPNINQPCSSVTTGEVTTCKLNTTTCGVNLDDVVQQVGNGITQDSIMWIQAWGGNGGSTDKGRGGGAGGYAQTTTTVNDIKGMFNGSAQLYFYLAHQGSNGGNHCGSAGGSATTITFEDLTLNPNNGPVPASPPTLLVAAGGGGGCGGNGNFGCFTPGCPANGGNGGVAIARLSLYGEGTGGQYASGMGGLQGLAGNSHCVECGSGNEKPGLPGFGGRGGGGGSGQSCGGPGAPALFYNTDSTTLDWPAGAGGKGSSNGSACDSGGGGGGGGWGGGGGGGHGNNNGHAIPGAGGGSFAAFSTRESSIAPDSRPSNPCGNGGCLQIQFSAQTSIPQAALPGILGATDCTVNTSPWGIFSGNYSLFWQESGNLVIFKNVQSPQSQWTNNSFGTELCWQGDGNLVVYDADGDPKWSSETADNQHNGNGGRLLTLYPNGLLEITNQDGVQLWHQGPFE